MPDPTPANKLLVLAQQGATLLTEGVIDIPTPPLPGELFHRLLEIPVYEKIEIHGWPASHVADLCRYTGQYDRYCPFCKRQTPWSPQIAGGTANKPLGAFTGVNRLFNQCLRCDGYEFIYFHFSSNAPTDEKGVGAIQKIGQMPSLDAFHGADVEAFDKVTTRAQRSDYLKAARANSQGFAAGACTYLRRVVEGLMVEERANHMTENKLTEWTEYDRVETKVKLGLLRGRLPDFLVENPKLYRVLSNGIHSLTEEQCAELFPNLQQAILLIFEERLARRNEADRKDQTRRYLERNG